MNKKIKLFGLLVVLLLCAFLVCSCDGDDPVKPIDPVDPGEVEIDWDSKTIDRCELDEASFSEIYDIDDFDLSNLKIHVYYTDGMDRLIPCTRDMMDDGDLDKLESAGTKKVVIYYNDEEFDTKINIVDYAIYDQDLNRMREYDAVIKAIRNGQRLEFILESENDIAGIQAKYTFDSSKFTMTNFKVEDKTDTYGSFEVKNGTLYVSFLSSKNIKGDVVLFSCDISGDFRNSNLKIDDEFANKVYFITEEGTQRLFKILYHVSKK